MKIAIIGHNGYIGSALYDHMISIGLQVSGIETDRQATYDLAEYHTIVYLAGVTGRKQAEPATEQDVFQRNVTDICNVYNALREDQLMLFASTAALYDEWHATETSNVFGKDKYTASMKKREEAIQSLISLGGRPTVVCARLSNVLGTSSGQRVDLGVQLMVKSAFTEKCIQVFDWNSMRSYVGMEDLLGSLMHLIRIHFGQNHTQMQIYNIRSFDAKIIGVANAIAEFMPASIVKLPTETPTTGFSIDSSKLIQSGYTPAQTLEGCLRPIFKSESSIMSFVTPRRMRLLGMQDPT